MTTHKPIFKVGDKVVVIPYASMGKWTHVDPTVNNKGVAEIIDWDVVVPNLEDVANGCPKEGYVEYNLLWKGNQKGRPMYMFAQNFLTRADTELAQYIEKFYKLSDARDRLKKRYDDTCNQLSDVQQKFRGY